MKSIQNLSELMADRLRKISAPEQQQLASVPSLSIKAHSQDLKKTLQEYRKTKELNIDRINQCFDKLEITNRSGKCEVIDELVEECQDAISLSAEKHAADASLIATMQQVNHFNSANYGTVASYARTLNKEDVAKILHNALEDEKGMDGHLSRIAEETINLAAVPA